MQALYNLVSKCYGFEYLRFSEDENSHSNTHAVVSSIGLV